MSNLARSRTAPELDAQTSRDVPVGVSRRAPGDAAAVVVLVVLPALVFGLPALLGHQVLLGDDLAQNFPRHWRNTFEMIGLPMPRTLSKP